MCLPALILRWYRYSAVDCSVRRAEFALALAPFGYPICTRSDAPVRVYCLPMWAAWVFEQALTLPVSLPELKSCAPSSVMDSGGWLPMKKIVVVTEAVFWPS